MTPQEALIAIELMRLMGEWTGKMHAWLKAQGVSESAILHAKEQFHLYTADPLHPAPPPPQPAQFPYYEILDQARFDAALLGAGDGVYGAPVPNPVAYWVAKGNLLFVPKPAGFEFLYVM